MHDIFKLKEIEEAFTDKEADEVLVNAHSDLLALIKRLTNEEETNRQVRSMLHRYRSCYEILF